jgi:hypothetical protein
MSITLRALGCALAIVLLAAPARAALASAAVFRCD